MSTALPHHGINLSARGYNEWRRFLAPVPDCYVLDVDQEVPHRKACSTPDEFLRAALLSRENLPNSKESYRFSFPFLTWGLNTSSSVSCEFSRTQQEAADGPGLCVLRPPFGYARGHPRHFSAPEVCASPSVRGGLEYSSDPKAMLVTVTVTSARFLSPTPGHSEWTLRRAKANPYVYESWLRFGAYP